jgi:hypothetical protein
MTQAQPENPQRDELELLCSRSLDRELSPAEQQRLQAALDSDPSLRALLEQLRESDAALRAAAPPPLGPAFTDRVLRELRPRGRVLRARVWALAASLLIALGLLYAFAMPRAPEPPAAPPAPATALLVALSPRAFELRDGQGHRHLSDRHDGAFVLPVRLAAHADSHLLLRVDGGSAVLAPGAVAVLRADGASLELELLEGDVYLEGLPGRALVAGRELSLSPFTGVLVQREDGQYRAAPSHGRASIDGVTLETRQQALLGDRELTIREHEPQALQDWAVAGRADAIRLQVRALLGDAYERVPAEHWQAWDNLLRGVLARPSARAAAAWGMKLLLRHGFVDDAGEDARAAFAVIARIMEEGTSEQDLTPAQRDFMARVDRALAERAAEHPEELERARGMIHRWLEGLGNGR